MPSEYCNKRLSSTYKALLCKQCSLGSGFIWGQEFMGGGQNCLWGQKPAMGAIEHEGAEVVPGGGDPLVKKNFRKLLKFKVKRL